MSQPCLPLSFAFNQSVKLPAPIRSDDEDLQLCGNAEPFIDNATNIRLLPRAFLNDCRVLPGHLNKNL
jgi:hypothetical protein